MTTLSDKLWEEYGYLWPYPLHPRTQDEVFAEFTRRGFTDEAAIPQFVAWVSWDRWYTADPDDHNPNIKYLNVYETENVYGGPEEGGWYYEVGDPVASVPAQPWLTAAEETARLEELKSQLRDYTTGKLVSCVEDHYAQPYPSERPHYE